MKIGFFVVVIGFFTLVYPEVSAQEAAIIGDTVLYNQAGESYKNGEFVEALSMYEKIIDNGIQNPDVYYNASNAAYRCGYLGKAILFLERAKKLSPSDQDIRVNLDFLNTKKQDQESPPGNIITAFLISHYDAVNVNNAALWSGITFAFTMLLCITVIFTDKWIRYTAGGCASIVFLIFLISTGVFLHKAHQNKTVAEAIIMVEEANSYSGPGNDNTHIFTLHEGTKVVIERSQDSWNLIRLQSGAGGWIQAEAMEKI